MASTNRYLNLANSVIPGVAGIVFVLVRVGGQAGILIGPFVIVALLGIVQAVRASNEWRVRRSRLSRSAGSVRLWAQWR